MTASVPVLHRRTMSTLGITSMIFCASTASSAVGSANTVPRSWMALMTAAVIFGGRCPRIIGPRPSR